MEHLLNMAEIWKCYGWKGLDGGGTLVLFLSCALLPGWTLNGQYGDRYFFPSNNRKNLASRDYGAVPVSITLLNSQAEIAVWQGGIQASGGGCNNCLIQDDCPPGTCKCHSESYPGYCCLDCSATAASIRSITNELRRKNG